MLRYFIVFTAFTPSLAVLHVANDNMSYDLFHDCWYAQSDFTDFEKLGDNMGLCLKRGMYVNLVTNVEKSCVDVGDGVSFTATTAEHTLTPRDLFPLGEEPKSMADLVNAYSNFLSHRNLRWDLGYMYPGLVMTIGPTMSSDGYLEFHMERQLDVYNKPGPGQYYFRRAVLPHLLGARFNLLSLLPIIFGILVYVAKNAFVFSKLSLIISTLLALKSLFVFQHLRPPTDVFSDSAVGASEPIQAIAGPRPHNLRPDMILQMFTMPTPPFRGVNDHPRGIRNFSWE